MKGLFEASVLLVTATTVVASPIKVQRSGRKLVMQKCGPLCPLTNFIAVVQVDGPLADMDSAAFRPLGSRSNLVESDRGRRVTHSKFSAMRRRLEMFTVPFPHGCTWPLNDGAKKTLVVEPIPASRNEEDGDDDFVKNLELKRQARRFDHVPMNLGRRQVSEVTITTTTTTSVEAAKEGAIKTVTATATATETIGAAGGETRNGTEGATAARPAEGEALTTSAGEAGATPSSTVEERTSSTAAAGAEASPTGEASSTSSVDKTATQGTIDGLLTATQSGNVEATSTTAANEQTLAGGEASITSSAAVEEQTSGSSVNEGGATSARSASAPAVTRAGGGTGVSEFQNSEGISVPLELVGENIPKPESIEASGLPLTPDANQPQATTAGADLPAPTLSPEAGGSQGTLLQPEPLPGQEEPQPDNQNGSPSESAALESGTPQETSSPTSTIESEASNATDTAAGVEASTTLTETQTALDSEATGTGAGPAAEIGSSGGDGEPAPEASNSRGTEIESEGGRTVSSLMPEDILDMLNSAPPKRSMKIEELEGWVLVHDKIAARRREEQRGSSGLHARRLQRRKQVL